tara:strand:+ start:6549 stop:7421 length:873 start_codon:yes stop_codon:yes gene_type:complete
MSESEPSEQISKAFDNIQDDLVSGIQETISDEILPPDFQDRMQILSEYTMSPTEFQQYAEETDKYKWRSIHKPNMQKTEGYKNLKEGMENIEVIQSIRDAINSRHLTFANTPTFSRQCTQNADNIANEAIQKERADINKLKNYYNAHLDSYKSIYNYKKDINSIINNKKNELNKFANKIDTYKQNLFIDGRKDKYQNNNYDFYKSIYDYILIFYYGLVVCYFIFTPFFQEQKYKNMLLVSIIILYIILPFLLPYLLSLIHYGYEYIIESNNLRGEIISYPYIIEDKEKYE